MPTVHPAAEMFPTGDAEYVGALAEYLAANGMEYCQPVVLTPDGQLLEGRGRWAACRLIGKVPPSRVERVVNAWTYIIQSNAAALAELPMPRRAMLLGRVPMLGHVGTPTGRVDEPPSRRAVHLMTGVNATSLHRAQKIWQHGTPELIELASSGAVKLTTAVRMAETNAKTQNRFVERVLAGENPRFVALPTERRLARIPKAPPASQRVPLRHKHRYVRKETVIQFLDALASLSTIIDAAEDLEPGITPEEARAFVAELARKHIAYRRISDLLKERRDQHS
jgi:hypothetical protein